MKPLPYINLPVLADHERLVRGLHALGYRFCGIEQADEAWKVWVAGTIDGDGPLAQYPYVRIHASRNMGATDELPKASWTLVNSVNQFLDYTRRHHASQPVAAPHA